MPSSRHEALALVHELNRPEIHQLCSKNEALRRAIISRAYYAVFYMAVEVNSALGGNAGPAAGEGKHARLIADLKSLQPSIPQEHRGHWRSLVDDIDTLRKRRILADYHLQLEVDAVLALQTVNWAASLVAKLERYLPKASGPVA